MRCPILAVLVLAASPLAAQSAPARMTASATVVETSGAAVGEVRVTAAAGGAAEVSARLALAGRAPRVVSVVEGNAVTGTPVAWAPEGAGGAVPAAAERVRLRTGVGGPPGAEGAARSLTFVVAHVN